MYKRRKVQRELDKKKRNKMIANSGMVLGAFLVAPMVTVVTQNKVHAQTAQEAFIAQIAPAAQRLANENDLYASIMIAQAILETGWGKSTLAAAPNYNLFGIKGAYNGQSIALHTAEHRADGTVYYITANFRKYPSYTESLQDYVEVLKGSSYYLGAWKSNTSSYQEATLYLKGRYASAVNYNTMLNTLIEQYNLTQYDTKSSVVVTTNAVDTSSGTTNSSANVNGTYVVKSGDSIWKIANEHGMSMSQLRELNGLSSDLIHPNQVLKISQGTTPQDTSATVVVPQVTQPIVPPTVNTSVQVDTEKTYTVKSGDSVWLISHNHGITMAQLREWNNLSSDLIHPGQVLKVSQGATLKATPATVAAPQVTQPTVQPAVNTSVQVDTEKTYTVKSGDSVWLISHNHGITMAQLREWNNLSSDLIHPGQVLKVSQGTAPQSTASAQPTASASVQAGTVKTYIVKSGDSIWKIAYEHGMSMSQLRALNGLSSDLIHPGQTLIVE